MSTVLELAAVDAALGVPLVEVVGDALGVADVRILGHTLDGARLDQAAQIGRVNRDLDRGLGDTRVGRGVLDGRRRPCGGCALPRRAVVVVEVSELSPHAAARSAAEIRLTSSSLCWFVSRRGPLHCDGCRPSIRRDGGRRLACVGRHT